MQLIPSSTGLPQ